MRENLSEMGSWWGKRRESSEGNKKKKPWRQKSVSFFIGKLSNFDFVDKWINSPTKHICLELCLLKLDRTGSVR